MFTPDALDALHNGNLSDLDLSSDNEYVDPPSQQPRFIHVVADIVNRHQGKLYPPESDDEEETNNRAELDLVGGAIPTPDFADSEAVLLENELRLPVKEVVQQAAVPCQKLFREEWENFAQEQT